MFFREKKNSYSLNLPKSVLAGIIPIPFDPLTLPNYQAGYLMNRTTDIPAGSINPTLATGLWLDANSLSLINKTFRTPGATVLTAFNSYNVNTLTAGNVRIENVAFDVFTNAFNDYAVLIGFKRNTSGEVTDRMIFFQQNTAISERAYMHFNTAGRLAQVLYNAGITNLIQNISNGVINYDDANPHALLLIYDQTNKTIRFITEKGEDYNSSNAGYTTQNLQGNDMGDTQIGAWNGGGGSLTMQPAYMGDVIILNSVPNNTIINSLLAWECARLGIVHTPI